MVKQNISLAGFEDIFSVGTLPNCENVIEVELTALHAPDRHPFQVSDDESMTLLVKSIIQYGVREPGLARPNPDCAGSYELLCGNRRKRACQLAGLKKMPVIIRELDDDQAVISMVE